MAVLQRIKDSLREHGYVETPEDNIEPYVVWKKGHGYDELPGKKGRIKWTRGKRWVELEEKNSEEFELNGPDVYHEARVLCNCGKDYIFTSQGVKETEAEFFETIAGLFQIRVCYVLPSNPNNNGWRNFPLDTPDSEILAAIDAETPNVQTIGYYEGHSYVSLRKERKKDCYDIEREIRDAIDPTLFVQYGSNYHRKFSDFADIRIWKADHRPSHCNSYTIPDSLNVSIGGLDWVFDFKENVTIWRHFPYSRKSHAEGLAVILATIESEQKAMRK